MRTAVGARWTARQTSGLRTPMACVNHARRNPRLDWRARYAFRGRRSTRRRAYTRVILGDSSAGAAAQPTDDRVFRCRLVDAAHRTDHLGEGDPEPASLVLDPIATPRSPRTLKNSSTAARSSPSSEASGHVQGAGQPVQRLIDGSTCPFS